ncbi:HMA2 domain-containing protein [Tolypothrix sp. VBCCA 56010]|uniref:HMA2 domain-containing protein n=1 Tax=Tolypothrix sp. VBCCA 56010 TaxID=3137731 RepID=UPI003D7E2E7C
MLTNGYSTSNKMPEITDKASLKTPAKPISTKVVSSTPGRLRLRVAHSHRQPEKMQHIADVLSANSHINKVKTNVSHGSIVINHDGEDGSLENVLATLKDLGIIFADVTEGNTEAAAGVSSAVVDLNQRVKQSTHGAIDLRFLFPLGLAGLSLRQLLNKGLQIETIPWYVLAWYAFDSFIKLHVNSQKQSTNE